jgi:voltage-gated potassium channel
MPFSLRRKIYLLIASREGRTPLDKIINAGIIALILLNTLAVILESVDACYESYRQFFLWFETFSVIVFSIEYVLRVWTCPEAPPRGKRQLTRIKYIFSPGAIIDLIAVLPFYLPMLIGFDFRFLRVFRLIRFFRFFKLGRYMNASKVIGKVFSSKKEELVLSFFITLFLIIAASSIMYFVEHDAQPDKFSSIPETMWWSVATLTTVGYGDVYPVTILGKILTAFISILGIGMFALPAGILASGFSDEFRNIRKKRFCPGCGKELE